MSDSRDTLIGIIAVMVGILVIASSITNIYAINKVIGIGILFLGIWMLILSISARKYSEIESIIYLIIAIIAILTGLSLFGNLILYGFPASIWIYLTGSLILISGILALFGPNIIEKGAGILGIILSIIFIYLSINLPNIYYLAIILGIWLIVIGGVQFFISYEEHTEFGFFKFWD